MIKKITYAEIPKFDESTQYVIQLQPIESDDEIFYGVEVKDLELSDDSRLWEMHDDVVQDCFCEPTIIRQPTIEERTAALETATQQQAATLDEVVTILEAIV